MKTVRLTGLAMIALLCSTAAAAAYPPLWIRQTPKSADTYYYRVAQGTGDTPEKAITKAFVNAVVESAMAVDLPVDLEKLLKQPEDSVLVSFARFSRIAVNKVCWYTEPLVTERGYRAYVLCQVQSGTMKPEYKTFNCLHNREE